MGFNSAFKGLIFKTNGANVRKYSSVTTKKIFYFSYNFLSRVFQQEIPIHFHWNDINLICFKTAHLSHTPVH